MPPELRKYRLGPRLCPKPGHEYQQTGQSLWRGTHCVQCERERVRTRKPKNPVLAPIPETRPTLPNHLALTCFLSPIVCLVDSTHRYRNRPQWTLRDLADERCTMCVMQASRLALAGD